jgi:hypothetical protein
MSQLAGDVHHESTDAPTVPVCEVSAEILVAIEVWLACPRMAFCSCLGRIGTKNDSFFPGQFDQFYFSGRWQLGHIGKY